MAVAYKTADTKRWGEGKVHIYLEEYGALLCQPDARRLPVGRRLPVATSITCKRCQAADMKGRLD